MNKTIAKRINRLGTKEPVKNGSRVTKVMAEANRLAGLVPGEWKLWINGSAERLRVQPAFLEGLVLAVIRDHDKKAREAEAAERREEQRAERRELAARREQEREQRARNSANKRKWTGKRNASSGRKTGPSGS
jgi:hypothetical protein